MCMFVICMLCTEKRKDATGTCYGNKNVVTTMPVSVKKRTSSSASSSKTNSLLSSSSSSFLSAGSIYSPATSIDAAAIILPINRVTTKTSSSLSSNQNTTHKITSPTNVVCSEFPKYKAWI